MSISTASLLRSFSGAAAFALMGSAAAQDAENSPVAANEPPVVQIQPKSFFRPSDWNLSGEISQNYISYANEGVDGSYTPESAISLRLTSPSEHIVIRTGTDFGSKVFPGIEVDRTYHFTLGYENGRHGFEAGLLPKEYTLGMVMHDPHAPAAIRSILSGETHRDILGARFHTGFAFGAKDNWSVTLYGMGGRSRERPEHTVRSAFRMIHEKHIAYPEAVRKGIIETLGKYLNEDLLPELDRLKAEAMARSGELITLEDVQDFGAEAREFLQRARESLGEDSPYLGHIDQALSRLDDTAIENFHARLETDTGPVIERLHETLVAAATGSIHGLQNDIANWTDDLIRERAAAIILASNPSSTLRNELTSMVARIAESRPSVSIENTGGSETICADPGQAAGPIGALIEGLNEYADEYGFDTNRLEGRLDEIGDIGPLCIDVPMPSYALRYDRPENAITTEEIEAYAHQIDSFVERPVSGSEAAAAAFGIAKEAGRPISVPVYQEIKQFLKEGEAVQSIWSVQARLQYLSERADFHLNLGWTETQGWEGDGRQRIAGFGIGGSYKWLDSRRLKTYADFKIAAFENYHGLYNALKKEDVYYGVAAAYTGFEYRLRERWPVGASFGGSCDVILGCAQHAELSLGYNSRDFNVRAFYGTSKPVSENVLDTLDTGWFKSEFHEKTEFMGIDFTYRY